MKVLDIDGDLFLEDCCPLAAVGERPCLAGHAPWEESRLRRFLEKNCGLDRAHPIPGRIFDTHDKALAFWQELISSGQLRVPFGVTHCDAHSDLGIGYPGPDIVLNGVLPVRFPERTNTAAYYKRKQLDEANYLLFALAFRYIDSLENIRNPRSRRDMPPGLLSSDTNTLRLGSPVARLMEPVNGPEPKIPYREYRSPEDYRTEEPFCFAGWALSPRYAPREADALADIFREYITEI